MAKGAIQARKKKARKESKEQKKARAFNKFPKRRFFQRKKMTTQSDLLPEVNLGIKAEGPKVALEAQTPVG